MEAKLKFWLRKDLDPTNEVEWDIVRAIIAKPEATREDNIWYQQNAENLHLPPNHLGRVYWDKELKQFYLWNPIRKQTFTFEPDGFEKPDFIVGVEGWVERVEAEINFFSESPVVAGRYEYLFVSENKWKSVFNFFRWLRLTLRFRQNNWREITKNTRGIIHLELLSDGRPRYCLIVRQARTLRELSMFVERIRAKEIQPSQAWS